MAQANERKELHDLVDQMTQDQLRAVIPLLREMLPKPALPIEDEEITDAEKAAVAEADEWLKHNKPIPFEDVLADFGLTLEDLEQPKVRG